MKKHVLVGVLFCLLTTITYGQDKVTKYCEMTCDMIPLSKNLKIHLSFGKDNIPSTDSFNRNEIIKFFKSNKFQFHTDILNYMSSQGWQLQSSCIETWPSNSNPQYVFFFKKDY